MNLPAAVFAVRCLIGETFRQALAARTFWLLLAVSGLAIVFCLSIRVDQPRPWQSPGEIELLGPDNQPLTGPNREAGYLYLAFGAWRVELFRDAEAEVHLLQVYLALWVAGAGGTLLVLVFTAGFLPEFLQPSAASVLLAKPIPRWSLLVGKYLGVLTFVAFQAAVFFLGTWLALGLRTGSWQPSYLLGIPLLLINFAVVYSFSALLAVCTRNTVACLVGSILFWLMCFWLNYGRHFVATLPTLVPGAPTPSAGFRTMIEAAYWLMPKPADLVMLLTECLRTGEHFGTWPAFRAVQESGSFYPEWSVLTSLAFAALVLVAAARQLTATEY